MINQKIIKIYKQKLIKLNYANSTVKTYCSYVEKFLTSNGKKQVIHFNSNDFQKYLDNYNFTSVSQQNQIINSIKFLYEYVLNKKYNKVSFDRPKKEKKLPRVIEKEFLVNSIDKIENLKHKAIIALAYSTGMRVSEIINLKIKDIDSKRMIINIVKSKNRKDRIVPLSKNILYLLRIYFKRYKPKDYLFNGQKSLKYSYTSCNNIVKQYLGNDKHFHLLRHSNATALLESNTDLRIIQKLLGHSSSKTTEIYTHVSTNLLSKVKLPI